MGAFSYACPACGKTVRVESPAADPVVARYPEYAELIKTAMTRPEDARPPGKLAPTTILALISGLVLIGAGTQFGGFKIALFLVGGVLAVAGALKLANEARQPSYDHRPTPERAVLAYIAGIEQGRWDGAFACLSWVVRDRRMRLPPMVEVDVSAASVAPADPDALERYWAPFRGLSRSLTADIRGVKSVSDTLVIATVDMKAEVLRAGGGGTSVAFCVAWPLYNRDGRWYLLSGGLMET